MNDEPGTNDKLGVNDEAGVGGRDAAARLTIALAGTSAGRPVAAAGEIVQRAHAAGLLAATVISGVDAPTAAAESAATDAIHDAATPLAVPMPRTVSLPAAESVTVIVVDTEERLRAFLRSLDDVAGANAEVRLDVAGAVQLLTLENAASSTSRPSTSSSSGITSGGRKRSTLP